MRMRFSSTSSACFAACARVYVLPVPQGPTSSKGGRHLSPAAVMPRMAAFCFSFSRSFIASLKSMLKVTLLGQQLKTPQDIEFHLFFFHSLFINAFLLSVLKRNLFFLKKNIPFKIHVHTTKNLLYTSFYKMNHVMAYSSGYQGEDGILWGGGNTRSRVGSWSMAECISHMETRFSWNWICKERGKINI